LIKKLIYSAINKDIMVIYVEKGMVSPSQKLIFDFNTLVYTKLGTVPKKSR